MAPLVLPAPPRPVIKLLLADLDGVLLHRLHFYPEVPSTLARIRDAGVPVIALADDDALHTLASVCLTNLDTLIDQVYVRDAAPPLAELDPQLFLEVCDLYGVSPGQALHVSSDRRDLAVARRLGLHTAWAIYGRRERGRAGALATPIASARAWTPEVVLSRFDALFEHYEFGGGGGGGRPGLRLAS